MKTAVVLFTFNRLEHAKITLDSLSENLETEDFDLYIFNDGPRNSNEVKLVNEVRDYISNKIPSISFNKVETIFAEKNQGLANSIINGLNQIFNHYEQAIVIEDDNSLSIDYLIYMRHYLELFKNVNKIVSIGGFNFITDFPSEFTNNLYFVPRTCSYNWAIWRDRWIAIDWEVRDYNKFKYNLFRRHEFNKFGNDRSTMLDYQMNKKINSWAIRFCYHQYINGLFTVYPRYTKSLNFGNDGTGTHKTIIKTDEILQEQMKHGLYKYDLDYNITIDKKITHSFNKRFNIGLIERVKRWIKVFLKI